MAYSQKPVSLSERIEDDVRKALVTEIRTGEVEAVARVLESCINAIRRAIAHPNKDGRTALSYASQYGSPKMIDLLQHPPLHPISEFLSSPEYIESQLMIRDIYGLLPIHYAARENNIPIVRHFLNLQPDLIDALSDAGRTPVYYAIKERHRDMMKFLLTQSDRGLSIPGKDSALPIHTTVDIKSIDILGFLLDRNPHQVDIPFQGQTLLEMAITAREQPLIDLIFAAGTRALMGSPILINLVRYQNWKLYSYVMDWGYKVHSREEMNRILTQRGRNCKNEPTTLLRELVQSEKLRSLQFLSRCVSLLEHIEPEIIKDGIQNLKLLRFFARIGYPFWKDPKLLQIASRDIRHPRKRIKIIELLRALGCEYLPESGIILDITILNSLARPIPEKRVLKIRNRVYFRPSLFQRCLDVLHPY